jgi:hypothetical protein
MSSLSGLEAARQHLRMRKDAPPHSYLSLGSIVCVCRSALLGAGTVVIAEILECEAPEAN